MANVVNVLHIINSEMRKYIKAKKLKHTDKTQQDVQLAEYILKMLQNHEGYNFIQEEEETYDIDEAFENFNDYDDDEIGSSTHANKDPVMESMKRMQTSREEPKYELSSEASTSTKHVPSSSLKRPSYAHVPLSKRKQIVEFTFGRHKRGARSIDVVRNRFGKSIPHMDTIKLWRRQLESNKINRELAFRFIRCSTYEKFIRARAAAIAVHDIHFRQWALEAAREIGYQSFTASDSWVNTFKKENRMRSLKITRFITRKTNVNKLKIEEESKQFIQKIKSILPMYSADYVFNGDQSGFNKEVMTPRTIEIRGTRLVQGYVQSHTATTHSYTIMPLISLSGKLAPKIMIVLQERQGELSSNVLANMFQSPNLYVTFTQSGKMGKRDLSHFIEHILVPSLGARNLILFDSWRAFNNPSYIQPFIPEEKVLNVEIIPEHTTGDIQPLDRFGFRPWKSYSKQFSDYVRINNVEFHGNESLQTRNNVLKLQAIIHNQLSSPRFINMWKYAWYKCGYMDGDEPKFIHPITFAFKFNLEDCKCGKVAMVRCAWCKNFMCFYCLFKPLANEIHFCQTYVQ